MLVFFFFFLTSCFDSIIEDLCEEKQLLNDLLWMQAVVQHHGQLLPASLFFKAADALGVQSVLSSSSQLVGHKPKELFVAA